MFKKILIANRGEIACRVIKTAKAMGISTVAVYSDADENALHVRSADESVHIGGSASAESYLRGDVIISACQRTGADAVHPGYGFLSENADFATALETAGITFIGPGITAINVMGDKITSKKLAEEAGVNTIPGYTDIISDADHAVNIARDIGYPVMLKASAGGGGKGMRVVYDDDECRDGFERATNEAVSSFGDGRVFAEKFIEEPRHIEIQVIADKHGNSVYLGERECSIQRRHQKVIEEAPSPFLDEKTRQAMGEQALALGAAVDYASAGTVEFIVDTNKNFYFLEMNTRLQVEHPVTEMVTGQDLVELMIRIANNEKLPISQSDIKLNGWAIESRVYAEDPFRNFLPSIGRLTHYQPPQESATVRVDTGIEEGSDVSMFYDPMIAKLVTYGPTRDAAIEAMGEALDSYYIRGVNHNISFLNAVIAHPRFVAGNLSTNFIADEYPDGFSSVDVPQSDPFIPVAVAACVHHQQTHRATQISGRTERFELQENNQWTVTAGDQHYPLEVTSIDGGFGVTYNKVTHVVKTQWRLGENIFRAQIDGSPITIQLDRAGAGYQLRHRGSTVRCLVISAQAADLTQYMLEKQPPDLSKFLLSPMPGLLVSLKVATGTEVQAGEELAVVEAMKMENSLRAEQNVVVAKVLANEGESLTVDQPILEFE